MQHDDYNAPDPEIEALFYGPGPYRICGPEGVLPEVYPTWEAASAALQELASRDAAPVIRRIVGEPETLIGSLREEGRPLTLEREPDRELP